MLQGIDVSSYQPENYPTAGLSFVFIKVTEGLSYTNPKWTAQRATARAAGLVTGFYHYPHIANSATAEADFFLSRLNLAPGDVLCLDWEWYGQSVSAQQARSYKDAFIARVRSRAPGHRIVAYSDVSNWTGVDQDGNAGDGLWIATAGRPAGQPGIRDQWTFHQYTDSGPGGADGDVANPALFPTIDALRAWALDAPSPTPAPAPAPPEDDMPQWINGSLTPSAQPAVVLVPHGNAWTVYPHRTLHLGMDEIGTPGAHASVRVAVHNGTAWREVTTATVTAAGGTVDVDLAAGDVKVSLQTDAAGVSYAIETY